MYCFSCCQILTILAWRMVSFHPCKLGCEVCGDWRRYSCNTWCRVCGHNLAGFEIVSCHIFLCWQMTIIVHNLAISAILMAMENAPSAEKRFPTTSMRAWPITGRNALKKMMKLWMECRHRRSNAVNAKECWSSGRNIYHQKPLNAKWMDVR